ncbi:MAG: gamma-glutamyl-phosphate reductase, partial [Gammaproteobacteria bacterium]
MTEDVKQYMQVVGERARAAAREIAKADTGKKNKALEYIADAIDAAKESLGVENQKDM